MFLRSLIVALSFAVHSDASDKTKAIAIARAASVCEEADCKCTDCSGQGCKCGCNCPTKSDVTVEWVGKMPEGINKTVDSVTHKVITEYAPRKTAKCIVKGPVTTFQVDEIPSTSMLLALIRDSKTVQTVTYRQVCQNGVCTLIPVQEQK